MKLLLYTIFCLQIIKQQFRIIGGFRNQYSNGLLGPELTFYPEKEWFTSSGYINS
jgi:hypothetical protein